jgi:hypothetical protein
MPRCLAIAATLATAEAGVAGREAGIALLVFSPSTWPPTDRLTILGGNAHFVPKARQYSVPLPTRHPHGRMVADRSPPSGPAGRRRLQKRLDRGQP